jgi:hypothetical protein
VGDEVYVFRLKDAAVAEVLGCDAMMCAVRVRCLRLVEGVE